METEDMQIERIPPGIEKPFRKALGHAIRNELDDFRETLEPLPDEELLGCVGLCMFTAGYVAIDVCGWEWPNEENLRKIARAAVKPPSARRFGLSADDAYAYVKRAALQFEPLDRVFPAAGSLPEENRDPVLLAFVITGHVLTAYCPQEIEWWEFLGQIEEAYEISEVSDLDVLPGMMLRARRIRLTSAQ